MIYVKQVLKNGIPYLLFINIICAGPDPEEEAIRAWPPTRWGAFHQISPKTALKLYFAYFFADKLYDILITFYTVKCY